MVCHDGSAASKEALEAVYHGLLRDADKLSVAHVMCEEKEKYLSYDLKENYIKSQTEALCASLGERFKYHSKALDTAEHETAKHALGVLATEYHATIQVVGFHGRKGPKADPTVMGSAVQFLSIEAVAPILIIKDPHNRKDRPNGFRFCACVDGSEKSLKALKMICDVKSPGDKITVIICEQANLDTGKVCDIVAYNLEESGCLEDAIVEVLSSEDGKSAATIIREYLLAAADRDHYVDYIMLGNQGADFSKNDKDKYLGSVANEII